ncbi:MAG TPA: sulfatase-like hydrolase/transferase, partial [Gemmataceae bacterium]
FDVCFPTEAKVPTWDPMRKPKGETGGTWWDPAADPREAEDFGTRYWDERGEAVTENLSGDDSRVIMDRPFPFIERAAKQKKPFLAVIWFHAPHLPVVAGPQYTALYAGHPKHHRHYYGCVTAMDEQVGRLRQELARLGVADDTMLWFCADNGPEGSAKFPGSAGPFRGRKRSLHEGGVRVPGVLVWPARVRPGSVTDFPAVTSDYLPTVLAALGVRYPDDRPLDGIDLLPVIDGRVKERDRPIGFQTRDAVSWVTQRYKLIGPADGEHARKKPKRADAPREWMLFDLLKDPGETADLAAKHPEIVEQMKSELAAWRESCARSDRGEDYK